MTAERRKVTREDILNGASALLNGGNYADLTVDALARSMRMSKSTLYKHFLSKQALIVALVDDACQRADADATAAMAATDANARLSGLRDAAANLANRLPAAVFTDAGKLPRACKRRLDAARTAMAGHISAAVSSSGSAFGDASVVGTTYVASAFAAVEQAARAGADRADAVRSVHRLVVSGLAAA